MRKIFIVSAICLLMLGCKTVSSYKLSGQALEGQERLNREGIEDIVSFKKATVFIRPSKDIYAPEINARPSFIVGVKGDREFEFSTDNIKAYVDGNPHRIMTYEELLKEVGEEYSARLASAKAEHEARSFKATQDSVKDLEDPSVFKPGDNRPGNRSTDIRSSKTTINTKELSEDLMYTSFEFEGEAEAIQQEALEAIKKLQSSALIKTKVSPDKWYAGEVVMDYMPGVPASHKIKIMVDVNGEDHEFALNYIAAQ